MSTISPTRTDTQDPPPRGRRWPLVVSLVLMLLAGLVAATAALHSLGGRQYTTGFTATGAHQLVIAVHTGRIQLVGSPDGTVRVTTTRRWSLWAPRTRHTVTDGILTVTGDCPPLGRLGPPAAPSTSGSASRPGRGSG